MIDEARVPPSLNRLAVVGVIVSTLVAAGALFALPWLRETGLSFRIAFTLVSMIEFIAALGAGYSAFRLYEEPEED